MPEKPPSHANNHPNSVEQYRFNFLSSELNSTLQAIALNDLTLTGESLQNVLKSALERGVWWLDAANPSETELDSLSRILPGHWSSRNIQTPRNRGKAESLIGDQNRVFSFRSILHVDEDCDGDVKTRDLYLAVFKNGILSFGDVQSPHAMNAMKKATRLRDYLVPNRGWMCYVLLNDIVDTFTPSINAIERKTEGIEDLIVGGRTEDSTVLLGRIARCCRMVTMLTHLLSGTANTTKELSKCYEECHSGVRQENEFRIYLSDIQDHIQTMMSDLGHLERMLTYSHANYLMQLGVNSVEKGNRVKHALGVITLVATVFATLNVICTLFGVNVRVPGKDTRGLHWFFAIIGVLAAIVVLSLVLGKRMKCF